MISNYTEKFSEKARARGITKLHFHIEESEKREVAVFNGAPEITAASKETLLLIEGEYKGFVGSAYTEDWDEGGINALIENILETAELNKAPYVEKQIKKTEKPDPREIPFNIRSMTEELLTAEKAARSANTKVENFRMGIARFKKSVTLLNGEGLVMTDESCFLSVMCKVMAKDGAKVQTAQAGRLLGGVPGGSAASLPGAPAAEKPDLRSLPGAPVAGKPDLGGLLGSFPGAPVAEKPDLTGLAIAVASEACKMLSSAPCAGGHYRAVIRNSAFAELFGAFLPAFFADKCQNKMSFMAGKLGENTGSPVFSAYEDPHALISRFFDDEGTPTTKKALIENGKLASYFYNRLSAAKERCPQKSTGNGFRQDYKEGISTAYTNVIVKAGNKTQGDLLGEMKDGLLITACDGVFAGVNPVSGDFSLIAKGFMVKDGAPAEPVSGITIGGNLCGLLAAVEGTASDTVIVRTNTGIVGSPSVAVSKLIISG